MYPNYKNIHNQNSYDQRSTSMVNTGRTVPVNPLITDFIKQFIASNSGVILQYEKDSNLTAVIRKLIETLPISSRSDGSGTVSTGICDASKTLVWVQFYNDGYHLISGKLGDLAGEISFLILGGHKRSDTRAKAKEGLHTWIKTQCKTDCVNFSARYGLTASNYKDYIFSKTNTWNLHDPAYPITSRSEQGQRNQNFWSKVKAIYNDSYTDIREKVEKIKQLEIKLDLHGLQFVTLQGSVLDELKNADGKLIGDIIHQTLDDKPIITRVIEPMAGSGTYGNWVRLVGFDGELIVNDSNPLIPLTYRFIVNTPDQVIQAIKKIKNQIVDFGRAHGFQFDEKLELTFKNIFPEVDFAKGLIEKEKERSLKKETLKAIIEKHEPVILLRREVTKFLKEKITPFLSKEGEITPSEALQIAASFYIMQNASNNGTAVTIESLQSEGQNSVPMRLLTVKDYTRINLFPKSTNDEKLNFISYIHQDKKTQFISKDGWELLERCDASTSDLVILSGHFGDEYLTEEIFIEKIKKYVIPVTEKGAKVLIINAFSELKDQEFKQLGFEVSRHLRPGIKAEFYLLALKNISITVRESTPDKLIDTLASYILNRADVNGLDNSYINSFDLEEGCQPLQTNYDARLTK